MMMLGAARPGLDHNDASSHAFSDSAYYICASNGDLFGHGKECDDRQGQFEMGDRIGMLLDLDAGWLRFYRNGKRCGPGFTKDVTGPMVRAAQLLKEGCITKALPSAEAPEGAGAADEPWDEPEPESEADY